MQARTQLTHTQSTTKAVPYGLGEQPIYCWICILCYCTHSVREALLVVISSSSGIPHVLWFIDNPTIFLALPSIYCYLEPLPQPLFTLFFLPRMSSGLPWLKGYCFAFCWSVGQHWGSFELGLVQGFVFRFD